MAGSPKTRGSEARSRKQRGHGEGSLWWHEGRQRWTAEVQIGGRIRRASAPTKEEAGRLLRDLLAERDQGYPGPEDHERTVGDAIDAWLERKEQETGRGEFSEGSLRDYQQVSRDYLVPLRGVTLAALRPQQIEDVIAEFAGQVGAQRILRTLRQALTYARANGWLDRDPTVIIRPRRKQDPRPDVIEPEQLAASLPTLIGSRLEHLATFQLATGLSSGEVYGLCWDKIDFDKSLLHVHRTKRKVVGIVDLTKVSSRYRTVHLPALAVQALRDQRTLQDSWRRDELTWEQHPKDPVFTSERGAPLDDSVEARTFRLRQERKGIKDPIQLGKLRRAHATLAYNLDVPGGLATIADQLGHADIRTTKKHYAAVAPRTSKAYADLMDAALRHVRESDAEVASEP